MAGEVLRLAHEPPATRGIRRDRPKKSQPDQRDRRRAAQRRVRALVHRPQAGRRHRRACAGRSARRGRGRDGAGCHGQLPNTGNAGASVRLACRAVSHRLLPAFQDQGRRLARRCQRADAYRIFSVLNNRGLDLAPIDIIKAQVLGLIRTTAGDVKSRAYAKEWSRIETALGREAFGDLFGHIRSIYAKKKQKYILVKEFQEHVTEYKTPIDLVDKVIKPYAEVWDFVRDADFEATEHAETINEHLSWLNRVDFKDWVPPALVYFKRFRQQPKLLAEFFQSLERLTYFLLVTKVGINERIETYAALTKEIEPEAFKGDLAAVTTLTLTDAQKRKFVAALDGDVYDDLPKARFSL